MRKIEQTVVKRPKEKANDSPIFTPRFNCNAKISGSGVRNTTMSHRIVTALIT